MPSQTVMLAGCVVIVANVLTVSVAADEVPGTQRPLEIIQRYWYVVRLAVAPVMVSVARPTPE
ncbi:MAG: hypothetical protein IPP93_11560 [Chitinophagaceae bacterium]|nr:hypothetical protein [Chitinophagaceae bacterium]